MKIDIGGSEVARLARPPHPAYEGGRYAPTSVAVDEVRHGGSGSPTATARASCTITAVMAPTSPA